MWTFENVKFEALSARRENGSSDESSILQGNSQTKQFLPYRLFVLIPNFVFWQDQYFELTVSLILNPEISYKMPNQQKPYFLNRSNRICQTLYRY